VIVVDASVVVDLVLARLPGDVVDRLLGEEESVHAPHLLDVEVAQVLRRYVRSGQIGEARGAEAITDLGDLRTERHPHDPFLSRIWELRHNLTAYDAVYVALAEALAAPLLTRDGRLANAPGHRAEIELI
jgi:predicted nucleic acid-binding protein